MRNLIYITIPCILSIPIGQNFLTIFLFVNSAFFLVNSSIFLVNCPQFLPQVDSCFPIVSLSSKVPWANNLYARFQSAEKNKKNMRIKRLPNGISSKIGEKIEIVHLINSTAINWSLKSGQTANVLVVQQLLH